MKTIIILETNKGNGGDRDVRYLFWFAVPAARRTPLSGHTSPFRDITPAELADIVSGAVIEELHSGQFPASYTAAQIKSSLESQYAVRQAALAALPNPNQFYGVYRDNLGNWSA